VDINKDSAWGHPLLEKIQTHMLVLLVLLVLL
jgi:hypothetical protein